MQYSVQEKSDFQQIKDLLGNYNNIIIAGHVNPDGDAIGACFSLALCLHKTGKTPYILLGNFLEKYGSLTGNEFIYNGDYKELNPDIFISVDSSSIDRLDFCIDSFNKAKYRINIDHHISNTRYADYNFVYEASSASEIMYGVISHLTDLDKDICSAIYAGIIFDTNGFKHQSTTARTHRITASLMEYGIDFNGIYRQVLDTHYIKEAKALSLALNKMRIMSDESDSESDVESKGVSKGNSNGNSDKNSDRNSKGYPIAYTSLTINELHEVGAEYKDLDDIISYMSSIIHIEAAVFFTERENNTTKASIRTKNIDACKVARKHNGGGHERAAGCTLNCSVDEAIKIIINDIINEMRY